jgi:transcriptional regulator with GAF, ATPase, and Fis domain
VPPDSRNVETLQALERNHIIATLKRTGGVIEGPNGAARLLGMSQAPCAIA